MKKQQAFWPKYQYVSDNWVKIKIEDILKVMETLGGVALKLKLEEKMSGPFGFNKKKKEEEESAV